MTGLFLADMSGQPFWQVAEHALVLVSIIAALAAVAMARRKREDIRITGQPIEVSGDIKAYLKPHDYNSELSNAIHMEIARRLEAIDGKGGQIEQIWFTLRKEDAEIRESLKCAVRDFDQTINHIAGTLAAIEKSNNMILRKLIG